MKIYKKLLILFTVLLLFILVGCQNKNNETKEETKNQKTEENKKETVLETKVETEKETEAETISELNSELEKDIPANHIVPNIEKIYEKKSVVVLYWLHDTPGNPHYHESLVGFSDDIKNVTIKEVELSEVSDLEKIPSTVKGKEFYRNSGKEADTLYIVNVE